VDRLSGSLGVPGAHGNSCETAGYFNSVYVRPLWKTFQSTVENSTEGQDVVKAFPFRISPHDDMSNLQMPSFQMLLNPSLHPTLTPKEPKPSQKAVIATFTKFSKN